MKPTVIIQARMTSTRLPGKVLMTILDKPLLGYLVERIQRASLVENIVIATTDDSSADPIVNFCADNGIDCVQGDTEDVLSRYYLAATTFAADPIIRITGDCPVIDPDVVDKTLKHYLTHYPKYEYVSNILDRKYPRGMDTEVFSFKTLEKVHQTATKQYDREHVTAHFYTNPDQYNISGVSNDEDLSAHRWTVDTKEDLELIKKIIETLYPQKPEFTLDDIIELLKQNPKWSTINRNVKQKAG